MSQDNQKDQDINNNDDQTDVEPGTAEEAEELGLIDDADESDEDSDDTKENKSDETGDEGAIVEDSEDEVVTEELLELEDVPVQKELPEFRAGDTVKVYYKIIEGNKTRIQPFEGIVISRKGEGISKTFTVRKIAVGNIGVERIFPTYTPNITKLEVTRKGKVRKAKLYYLREKVGKAAVKVKERKAK